MSQCASLKTNALNLPVDKEALSVGSAVSVAINSLTYWKDNAASWMSYLVSAPAGNYSTLYYQTASCPINLKSLGGADIAGAIGGGEIGAGGGLAGVVAGGILGSAVSSSYNILGQAAQCMPGTVGNVSRRLADWF